MQIYIRSGFVYQAPWKPRRKFPNNEENYTQEHLPRDMNESVSVLMLNGDPVSL